MPTSASKYQSEIENSCSRFFLDTEWMFAGLSYSTAGAEVSHGPSLNVLVKLCKHICNPATGETSEARLQDAIDRAAAHGLTYQRPLEARCDQRLLVA